MLGKNYTVKNFGVCNRTAIPKYPYGYKYSEMIYSAKSFKPDIVIICLVRMTVSHIAGIRKNL